MIDLKGRDVLNTHEWTKAELDQILKLAYKFKAMGKKSRSLQLLQGKTLLLLFFRGSTRTRISFTAARNRHRNRASPIEARLCCQAGCGAAATGLSRKDTNELVKTLLSKYEHDIPNAPLGKQFQECYDVKSLRPTPEHTKLYSEVKKELKDLGVPFSY
jgi:hypothetical protein